MSSVRPVGPSVFAPSRSIVQVPRSEVFARLEWLAPATPYGESDRRGDTFPVSWAPDDHQYTAAGDPVVGPHNDGLDVQCIQGMPPEHKLLKLNAMPEYKGWGGGGAKPTGMISVGGKLYLAFQNAVLEQHPSTQISGGDAMINYGHGYDAHVVCSEDCGLTWKPSMAEIVQKPMFPGRIFGAPAFINFGKDNAGARDGYVYAISGEGWDNGVHCRLGRVPAGKIMDISAWEFTCGYDAQGQPQWTSELAKATPVLTHPGYLGAVDMVYLASARRYLLLSWHHKVKANPDTGSELVVYDAPEPWGPFTLVHHEDLWETLEMNPYNPRLPLKWFNPQTMEGWLMFSGSWRHAGQTPYYRLHVRPFRLVRR